MQKTDTPSSTLSSWIDRWTSALFIWPSVALLLLFSIFPLLVSLYLSFSRLKFVKGAVEVLPVGILNYRKLLWGSEQNRFLGVMKMPSLLGWVVIILIGAGLLYVLLDYLRSGGVTIGGVFSRTLFVVVLLGLVVLMMVTMTGGGRPGTLPVTLFYVSAGILLEYLIGLGLALLAAQQLAGRRFFRIVFLLPMMITPVGVAFMIRMMADTSKGPFSILLKAAGLGDWTWVTSAWASRIVILIGDVWQWTPFMFIVLVAAIESQGVEPVEAAVVDGANRWQIFRHITLPTILPVSTALILIRMIEAFKLVDLPRVMTGGGPGTATESITMHSFSAWTARDYGGSAAIAYILLVLVTIVATAFVNLVRQRTTEVV